jgi:hypothetical protein
MGTRTDRKQNGDHPILTFLFKKGRLKIIGKLHEKELRSNVFISQFTAS